MAKIKQVQIKDQDGDLIKNCNNPIFITSSTTTVIFAGEGLLQGVQIWADVDSGTFYFTNTAGAAITGLPSSTAKAKTDYVGTFAVPNLEISAGLKVVTESTTGIVMTVYSSKTPA
jgi:hypothetical protein